MTTKAGKAGGMSEQAVNLALDSNRKTSQKLKVSNNDHSIMQVYLPFWSKVKRLGFGHFFPGVLQRCKRKK